MSGVNKSAIDVFEKASQIIKKYHLSIEQAQKAFGISIDDIISGDTPISLLAIELSTIEKTKQATISQIGSFITDFYDTKAIAKRRESPLELSIIEDTIKTAAENFPTLKNLYDQMLNALPQVKNGYDLYAQLVIILEGYGGRLDKNIDKLLRHIMRGGKVGGELKIILKDNTDPNLGSNSIFQLSKSNLEGNQYTILFLLFIPYLTMLEGLGHEIVSASITYKDLKGDTQDVNKSTKAKKNRRKQQKRNRKKNRRKNK